MNKSPGSLAVAAWPCDAIVERSYEYLDGELSADAEGMIREHLAACDRCRRVVKRDQAFLSCLERAALIEPAPPELRERVCEALDDAADRELGAPPGADYGDQRDD
jgi:mycothiol system anti-sigma-R factor